MNIFILSEDPVIAAQSHCDKHVVKLILESAQMLCSVFPAGQAPYKRTHYSHPCSIWARTSKQNYEWLINYGLALCNEYTYRYNKTHKSMAVIQWCRDNMPMLPDSGLTRFAQAMPDKYKCEDVVQSYHNYYIGEKTKLLTYTKRKPPEWISNRLIN